ncbi:hypothetical protein HK103_002014 [Boothiomyces macroporosus]|uniref:Uncharacterized protein n=1 Tax=Boothiomyces macroporosus TaxID=261099 RepID=A0AAD5U9Y4_9FUNG|nr:hypothetical protein HK103_002014 [Boothiomyces macroporosus]
MKRDVGGTIQSPKEVLAYPNSISDHESNFAKASIKENYMDNPKEYPISSCKRKNDSDIENRLTHGKGSTEIDNPAKRLFKRQGDCNIFNKDDESQSVSAHDEEDDHEPAARETTKESTLGESDLDEINIVRDKDLPNISGGENGEISICSDSDRSLQSNTPNPSLVALESSINKSAKLPITLDMKLMHEIETRKEKLKSNFMNWMARIPEHHAKKYTLLTEVFRVHLPSLKEGEYWLASDSIRKCDSDKTPNGVTIYGRIISEESIGKAFIIRNGEESVELRDGYCDAVTDQVTIVVLDGSYLAVHDRAKPSFKMVYARPSDLYFKYNPDMLFVGEITADGNVKVNILGREIVHPVDFYPNGSQIIYCDHLSRLQKIYPNRVVAVNVLSEYVAIVDFNYSYSCYTIEKSSYIPKFIDIFIPAGTNPLYY